jgi:hypothetical protein
MNGRSVRRGSEMHFDIVDTESVYGRLLDAPDAEAREAIFREEMVQPFQGLVRVFGGDGMAVFARWGMAPDQFVGDEGEEMAALVEALAEADAWTRAEEALRKHTIENKSRRICTLTGRVCIDPV